MAANDLSKPRLSQLINSGVNVSRKRRKWRVNREIKTLTPSSAVTAKDPSRTIVTDCTIAFGSKFGPFPGKDAVESKFSNWMQFVTGVQSLDEANLVSFIYEKQLYFYCIRSIHPGMELFVWAGARKNHILESQWLKREAKKAAHKYTFICQECDATYSSHIALFTHWPSTHCPAERKIPQRQCKCPYCPKIISCKNNLRTHVLRHFGVITQAPHSDYKKKLKARMMSRRQTCKPKKIVTTEEKLVQNESDRPVVCEICGMSFKLNAHLGTHKKYYHGMTTEEKDKDFSE